MCNCFARPPFPSVLRQLSSIDAKTTLIGHNILSRLAEPLIVFHSCESPLSAIPVANSPPSFIRSNATLNCSFFAPPTPLSSTTLSYNLITRKAAQTAAREQGKRGRYILDFPSLETSSSSSSWRKLLSERKKMAQTKMPDDILLSISRKQRGDKRT